ncbi:MAG: hypothetical protein Q4Q58_07065 [Thermoplasmata archaeon]|nr:hypothetical protein [Thermoplasmata archaeon]
MASRISSRRLIPSSLWDAVNSSLAGPPSVLTLKPTNPRAPMASSLLPTLSMSSGVMRTPVWILVARQELDSLFQVSSLSDLDSLLIWLLVSPASLSGERIPISARAFMPGRSSTGSDALVPSATTS